MAGGEGPDTRDDRIIAVRTDASELRAIRLAVDEFVTANGGDADVAADLQLAACELATNVMQHSPADSVTVSVRRNGETWELDVSDADRIPELAELEAPPPSSTSGRGLVIVQAVMDDVRLLDEGAGPFVRCTRRAG